jgi:hypothetical protein
MKLPSPDSQLVFARNKTSTNLSLLAKLTIMTYNIHDHGDYLEREATQLVRERFSFYERVWSIYVGNRGNDSMATLPNYPNEDKRKHFAENSYSVLESVYLLNHILETKVFEKSSNASFKLYVESNLAFITVFALLGRIHDTAIKASNIMREGSKTFKDSLAELYKARNIVIHDKKVPQQFDDLGRVMIPSLKTWDEQNHWADAANMKIEYVTQILTNFFDQLLSLINSRYAALYGFIQKELKSIPTAIEFEHNPDRDLELTYSLNVSGTTSYSRVELDRFKANPGMTPSNGVDVYSLKGKSITNSR